MPRDNNMTGVLFQAKPDTDPKYGTHSGNCEINRVEFWLAGFRQPDNSIRLEANARDKNNPTIGSGVLRNTGPEKWGGEFRVGVEEYDLDGATRVGGPRSKIPGVPFLGFGFLPRKPASTADFPAAGGSPAEIPF